MTLLRSKSLQRRTQRLGRCLNSPSGRTSSTISGTPLRGHRYGLVLPALAHGAVRSRVRSFNFATAIAALLVVLIAPGLGALADLHQRRIPYLVFFTLVVVFLTAGLDFTDELTGAYSWRSFSSWWRSSPTS